jgi:hypothetical protein
MRKCVLLIGKAMFLLESIADYERSQFELDPRLGLIRWSRKRNWSKQGGCLQEQADETGAA